MSKSMGIASALLLSSLFLSPFAMAEESPSFAALNVARHAAFEQHQVELANKAQETNGAQQTSATQGQTDAAKAS